MILRDVIESHRRRAHIKHTVRLELPRNYLLHSPFRKFIRRRGMRKVQLACANTLTGAFTRARQPRASCVSSSAHARRQRETCRRVSCRGTVNGSDENGRERIGSITKQGRCLARTLSLDITKVTCSCRKKNRNVTG